MGEIRTQRSCVAQPVPHEAHTLDAVTATARPKQVTRSLAWSVERDSGVKTCRTYGHVLSARGRALDGVQDPRQHTPTPEPTAVMIGGVAHRPVRSHARVAMA